VNKDTSLNSHLENSAKSIWPDIKSRCSFRPALQEDKNPGVFSTDFCIDLSSELNKAPTVIAEELLAESPAVEGVSWTQAGDFICVDLAHSSIAEAVLAALIRREEPVPSAIVIPPYVRSASPIAYLRTISLAWEQFVILRASGVGSRLYSGDRKIDSIDGFSEYCEAIQRLKNGEVSDPEGAYSAMSAAMKDAAEIRTFVWLASDALPKRLFQGFFHEHIHRNRNHILRCPDVNWNMSREALKIPEFMKRPSADQLFAFLMYVTSEVPATDLDFSVPALEEKDNIVWFLSSLLSRIDRIARESSQGSKTCGRCSESAPSVLPRLERMTALYPFFLSRAKTHGEIERLNRVIRRIAQLLNIALNDPCVRDGLRGKMEHGGVEVIERTARIFGEIYLLGGNQR